ncbi:SMC-Scp complex subunit ScpB [Shewanella sp. NIFS-20-20]|uniref:SMC-Scp complex subunit ScpB n=1 Tax=Shewanella sp. NIFS-20-20 TaxID=2853806 RepID=UPI001C46D674|nr:SMC-Scp complex subunit ScpB [Shewanella sp. NIFS-20-20]MBV7315047.1 SMC-Scp complex subunit ScpB [Shewanella sp. NIFS-20-20]
MPINDIQLKQLLEAGLFAQGRALTIKELRQGLLKDLAVSRERISEQLAALEQDYLERGVQLVKVAGGYRFQTREELAPFLQLLTQEKAPKYSRATLETLAVIAYSQPVTRGEIEQIRGVAVASQIIKTLTDRLWIRVVGHKDVPGRPALYASTPEFLAYFGLDSLADLPPLTDAESLAALFSHRSETAADNATAVRRVETNE